MNFILSIIEIKNIACLINKKLQKNLNQIRRFLVYGYKTINMLMMHFYKNSPPRIFFHNKKLMKIKMTNCCRLLSVESENNFSKIKILKEQELFDCNLLNKYLLSSVRHFYKGY